MSVAGKVDIALEIYDAVNNTLTLSGLSKDTAKKYGYFASELYTYIRERPQLQMVLQCSRSVYDMGRGASGYAAAARLSSSAAAMGAADFAERFAAKGNASAGGAIAAFVDYFAGIAKSLGIEMNECALAVTRVMLDVLSTIALADTGVGIWAAAMQALSVGADTKEMIRACST
ncbi:MAG: hypothetical protein ACLGXA_15070 [Acidobacteriota bacterium]